MHLHGCTGLQNYTCSGPGELCLSKKIIFVYRGSTSLTVVTFNLLIELL